MQTRDPAEPAMAGSVCRRGGTGVLLGMDHTATRTRSTARRLGGAIVVTAAGLLCALELAQFVGLVIGASSYLSDHSGGESFVAIALGTFGLGAISAGWTTKQSLACRRDGTHRVRVAGGLVLSVALFCLSLLLDVAAGSS